MPWPWLGAALLVLCAGACSPPATEPRGARVPGESRTLEGSWTASGTRHTLELERDHKASAAYVALVVLYVLMHYLSVSQSSQVLALFGVCVDVGLRAGVTTPLMAFARLFASSHFSTITPQGGSQNVICVGSGYLTQGELYRLGALTTAFCLLVFLLLGTPWLFLVVR